MPVVAKLDEPDNARRQRKRKAGFELEELLDDLLPQLRCFSCQVAPSVPQRKRFKCFDKCHSLCEKCNGACPCGSKVGNTECGLTSMLLDKLLPKPCQYFKAGCNEVFEKEDYGNHQRNCGYRLVACPSIGCEEKIVFSQLEDHLIVSHGFDCKHLIESTSVKRWVRDIGMQFGMERVANMRATDKGAKSAIL